jgi:hypothetical protein
MNFFRKATDFKIIELSIVTKSGKIDITNLFIELNIFDSMLVPVMSGNLLISDSIGLANKLMFDGSESILIEISKSAKFPVARFKKAFRIYKQSDRKNTNLTNEQYILHFVSDELMFSDQQKINQSFEGTYSSIVKRILENYLKIPKNNYKGLYENTKGIKKIVIPNLRPIDAIQWCTKRSIDIQNSPNFLFFQNVIGYNFASLSTLLTQEQVLDIIFDLKNQKDADPIDEMKMARAMQMVEQVDENQRIRDGVNAGKFIGFDPMTGVIANKNISYGDVFADMKHGNKNPNVSVIENRDGVTNIQAFDSKKMMNVFGAAKQLSNYIKNNDPTSLSKEENYESFMFQRASLIGNLMSRRLKLLMPGNFQLSSGFNVYINAPSFSKHNKGINSKDETLSGKYIILASRHVIGFDKHETAIEVATTSTQNPFIPASSLEETRLMLDY